MKLGIPELKATWKKLHGIIFMPNTREAYPGLLAGLERRMDGELPADWDDVAFNVPS